MPTLHGTASAVSPASRTRGRFAPGATTDPATKGVSVSVAEPIRRILRGRRQREWTDVVADYLARPLDWWGADAPRHADKVERKKRAIRARDGLDDATIVDAVVDMAAKRRVGRPAPVSITGLGGSGSHWLAAMLDDAADLVSAGEVYVPRTLLDEFEGMSDADQACAVDAITVLHAWPRSTDVWALGTINCAAGMRLLARHRRWFPNAVTVHLRRDPRDQVLSVTFRKPRFRRYVAPEATDEEYLRRMMRRNMTAYRELRDAADDVDVVCRYEALRIDPRPVLRQILAALGHPVDDDRLEQAVIDHAAETIRAGGAGTASNLDEGGRAVSWRELEDPALRRTLHAGLIDAICGLGYQPGDCMGSHLPDAGLPARTYTFASRPPGSLYQRVDGTWLPLDTSRQAISVAAGVPVLLRIGTDDAVDLRVLRDRGAGDVQALCLAGNPRADDGALAHMSAMTGLQTVDLAATTVTDDGLAHLEGLTELQQINLAGTRTTPHGRSRLAATLPQVTIWT